MYSFLAVLVFVGVNASSVSSSRVGLDCAQSTLIEQSGAGPVGSTHATTHARQIIEYEWKKIQVLEHPKARYFTSLVYDEGLRHSLLFGGQLGPGVNPLNDTWVYDALNESWSELATLNAPSPRAYHVSTYSRTMGATLVYGGERRGFEPFGDLWSLNSSDGVWTNITPPSGPGPLVAAAGIYAPAHSSMIVFGGGQAQQVKNGTWIHDSESNTWSESTSGISPPARIAHSMAYDSKRDRGILFGGDPKVDLSVLNDTWEFDTSNKSWLRIITNTTPPGRSWHSMAYDQETGMSLLFGGANSTGSRFEFLNDTWAFDPSQGEWFRVALSGGPPPTRYHPLVYDPVARGIVLFGGMVDSTVSYDSWILRAVMPPGPPRNFLAVPGDSKVQLSWQSPSSDGGAIVTEYRVYRSAAGGQENLIAEVSDQMSLSDADLMNGVNYSYRISAVNRIGEGPKSSPALAIPATSGPGRNLSLVVLPIAVVVAGIAILLLFMRARRRRRLREQGLQTQKVSESPLLPPAHCDD